MTVSSDKEKINNNQDSNTPEENLSSKNSAEQDKVLSLEKELQKLTEEKMSIIKAT